MAISSMTFITMSLKELDRNNIINRLLRKEIDGTKAAELLKLSVRQTKRLKAKVKYEGPKGLIHGNRGRPSHNQIPLKEKERIIHLVHKRYYDFKPGFATEKLEESYGILRDPKTIRQIMIDEKIWQPKRKKEKREYRSWRQRKSAYGEMIQFDGSYEYWFEERGHNYCLLAGIDDATGKIAKAKFALHEGVFPVFDFWQEYLKANGKPRAIYLDKFSTYNQNQIVAKENPDTLTQFQRAMEELRIEVIPANSPQAKGRVERLFGTLQDRLIKELRLQKISTISEANTFLEKVFIPKFNQKFSTKPRIHSNLHDLLSGKEQKSLSSIFSRQTKRTVQNDFTFSFKNQWYQLTENQTAIVCKKDTVMVEERLDNAVWVRLKSKYLNYKILPQRPTKLEQKRKSKPWVLPATIKTPYRPAQNHPWRQYRNQQPSTALTNSQV